MGGKYLLGKAKGQRFSWERSVVQSKKKGLGVEECPEASCSCAKRGGCQEIEDECEVNEQVSGKVAALSGKGGK